MKPVEPPKSLVEQTYDILVEAICTGSLPPGERLVEDDIAARLNVSRQPVNAALAMLRTNRLVEAAGRRGVVVAALDPDLFRDIYAFRAVVEPLAVELAGRRGIAEADRAAGEAVVAAGWDARHRGDVPAMVRADVAFHGLLYRMGGNRVVEETMRVYWTHIRRAMKEILNSQPDYPTTVWDEHERILAALVSGQTETAAAILREHLRGAFAGMEARLGPTAAQG
jgi:DNA-binding GntR family transcriptional regulator